MPKAQLDWYSVDTSTWYEKTDREIARELGVAKHQIDYWRRKLNVPTYKDAFQVERESKFSEGLNWCSGCKSYHPLDEFGKYKNGYQGLRSECLNYRKQYREDNATEINRKRREEYRNNSAPILAKNLAYRQRTRQQTNAYMKERTNAFKSRFVALAGDCCQRCGYKEFISGLEFHHIDRTDKGELPVKAINSGDFDRAYRELDKCVLLCRNCHQSYHASAWSAEFVKREGLGWALK